MDFCHASAYGQWGALQLELMQVQVQPSASSRDAVPAAGACTTSRGSATTWPRSSAAWSPWAGPWSLAARTPTGSGYAFHDGRHDLGHLVEVYAPTGRL